MLYFLKLLSLLPLLKHDDHIILARQTVSRRVSRPIVRAVSNISAASHLAQVNSSSSACAIEDEYCSFTNTSGTVEQANATNLDDRCLLWDSSCSGNRTLAMDRFFNTTFQNDLLSNACFAQVVSANSTSLSNCDKNNPPERMTEFQEMRNWMRSQQCVSAATEWAAMTPAVSNFTFANAKDDITSSEDPDSQMAAKLNPHPYNYSSGVAPSCCGICDINAQNVDIYYWPEPDANTSCLGIIGESIRPLDYGATTTEVSDNPTATSTATYWGCNPKTSTFYNPMVGGNVTYTSATTTAQITTIGSLLVKVPILNPWSSSPCLESGVISQMSNGSIEPRDKHAPINARGHTLITPSSVTQKDGLPVNTVVLGNFTFTSPSVYANFHGVKATDSCGGIIISSTMIGFAPGELATIDGPLGLNNVGLFATKSFDFKDLPCPPQSVMEANWYKPEPGEPYRPLIALPNRVKQIVPWLSYCTENFFTAYDPPSALRVATALAPPIPSSDPKAYLLAPVPNLTLDPGARQTTNSEASIPVPASVPIVDQPKATIGAGPAPPKKEVPNSKPQSNDPATQESPPSQAGPDVVEPNSDPKGGNDPQQNSGPQQSSDPKQGNDPVQASDPKQGIGNSGDSGQEADPKPKSDPSQVDSNQGSNQKSNPVPPNDPNQADNINPFNIFTEGQAKTINNQVVQPLSHGISIAGTTLIPGAPPITVSGTPIQFGLSALVIGTSTVPLATGNPTPITTTIAGHVITAAPNAIAVAGTTLTRGAPPITVSGTLIHFGSSALIVGTSTVPLAPEVPTQMITTIAGQAITAASNAVAIAGNFISPGAAGTTIDGTILSLDTAGHFVVGSKTIPLASKVPETITTTIAGQTITAAPNGIAVAGTTLRPGAPGTTLDGTLLSLDTASQLIVGAKTIPLESSSPNSIITTIGGQIITAAPNKIAIAGTALTPGAAGITVGGTLVSLDTNGQLVVGTKTIALRSGSTGLGGLVVGAFGLGGPFGPFSINLPSPTQGNSSTGAGNGTSTGVQTFKGNAASLKCRFLWNQMAVAVLAMSVLMYIC